MFIEALEGRQLMSVSVAAHAATSTAAVLTQNGGALTITNATNVQLHEDQTTHVLEVDDYAGAGHTYFLNGVTDVNVTGTKGNDTIQAYVWNINVTVAAGAGSDFLGITTAGSGNVTMDGGQGSDTLWTQNIGTGTFVVTGGGGNDSFHYNEYPYLSTGPVTYNGVVYNP